jgi:diguanylate cyclase (GGDEF)-like protein/PAS domain S-box-containing protein
MATVLASLLVVAAMGYASAVSRDDANSHRRVEVLAQQVRLSTQELSALQWQTDLEVVTSKVNLAFSSPSVASGLRLVETLIGEVRQLQALAPGPQTAMLHQDVSDLVAVGSQGFSPVNSRGGRSLDALEAIESTFQPVIARLDAQSALVAGHQQVVVSRALKQSFWTWIGSMLIGLLLLAVLGWRLAGLSRRVALADEVRSMERRSEARIRALVEHSSDVVTVLNRDLQVRWQAASVLGLLGLEPGTLIETAISSIAHPDDRTLLESFLLARVDSRGPATLRTRLRHADGRWLYIEMIAEDRFADPAVEGLVINLRDVSERVEFEEELRRRAFHDALTGLANRALFENRLRHALAAGLRTQRSLAVLFLDLDDFKTINDSLGHAAGDTLLRGVAARIDPLVRPTDTAARLGGDEFAVLLVGVEDEQEVEEIGARILEALAAEFTIDGRELTVTASMGMALSDDAVDADALLRNADMAMYAAKASGKRNLRRFEPTMHSSAVERLELRSELPRALEEDELRVHYQPIVSLASGRIVGVEALVRWQHPTRGLMPPGQFIALAEETGMIVALGRWVLARACEDVQAMQQNLPELEGLYVSVNVSIKQLHEERFPDVVAEILERTGLPAHTLVLEITEGLLADDRPQIVGQLQALKRLGLRVAVDDFGTGYSGLSHLQEFPIDILKIDKSFIDDLATNAQRANLVEGIINLGESLSLDVVAEGIEEPEQATRLRALRSKFGQGFFFSRPMSADAALALMRTTIDLPVVAASGLTVASDPRSPGVASSG